MSVSKQDCLDVLAACSYYLFGRFKDGSGAVEPLYISTCKLLGDVRGFNIIISALAKEVDQQRPDIIVGVVSSGLPFSTALSLRLNLPSITVRSIPESHGEGTAVQGQYKPNQRVVVIDDAIGDGESKWKCIEQLEQEGLQVCKVVTVWECGISLIPQLGARGLPIVSLVSHKELINHYVREGLLPFECGQLLGGVYDMPERWTAGEWEQWRALCRRYNLEWREPIYISKK